MIDNESITGINKDAISFFLEKLNASEKRHLINYDILLQQINSAQVLVDKSPYYCIIKFYHNGYSSLVYDEVIELQVLRQGENPVPTLFTMYFQNSVLYEFEYFNADSSEIRENELFNGDVIINFFEVD